MIDNIPVVVDGDFKKLIGRATVDEKGDLTIRVSKDQLLRELAYLIEIDQIQCLSIGIGYKVAQPAKESNGG